jgi:hypothetical protein
MRTVVALSAFAFLVACSPFEKGPGISSFDTKSIWAEKPTGLNAFDSKSFWCSGPACGGSDGDAGSDRSGDVSSDTAH